MPRTKTVRLRVCLQFEALATRLMTEEATSHKRNTEDEIVAAFEAQNLLHYGRTHPACVQMIFRVPAPLEITVHTCGVSDLSAHL